MNQNAQELLFLASRTLKVARKLFEMAVESRALLQWASGWILMGFLMDSVDGLKPFKTGHSQNHPQNLSRSQRNKIGTELWILSFRSI